MPPDHFIRHPSRKNLFDLADVAIDDYNEVGDRAVRVPGFDTPIAPNSNVVDFFIAHRLEIETIQRCVAGGSSRRSGELPTRGRRRVQRAVRR